MSYVKRKVFIILSLILCINMSGTSYVWATESGQNESEKPIITDNTEEEEDTEGTENTNTSEKNDFIVTETEFLQTKWTNITSSKMFLIEMEEGKVIRYEIFYSAKSSMPELLLISPDGDIYKQGVSNDAFVIKEAQSVPSNTDIKYSAVYIISNKAGTWKLSVTPNITENFLCIAESALPEKWQTLKKEVITNPEKLITWHLNEELYTTSDMLDVIKEHKSSEPTPSGMQSISKEPEEEPKSNHAIIYLLTAMICIICAAISYFSKQKKKQLAEKRRQQHIAEANEALAKERLKENELLEQMMNAHNDEYVDYPEEINYYEESVKQAAVLPPPVSNVPKETTPTKNVVADVKSQPVIKPIDIQTEKQSVKQDDTIINYF